MNTLTTFVVGLVAGAVIVFGLRAARLDSSAAAPTSAPPAAHVTPEGGPSAVARSEGAVVLVALDADGKVVSASMEMAGGASHAVAPGAHAPMGDYPARVKGRDETYQAHLHAHSEHRLELTLTSEDGDLIAQHTFEHGSAESGVTPGAAKLPENKICPVMGNEVDPEVFVDYEGRRIGFCCAGCDDAFLENPAKYLKKVDAELKARGEKK